MFTATLSLILLLGTRDERVEYARPELLIEPADLTKEKANGLRILDARGKGKYLDGHVPGAVWIDATTWARAFGEGEDQAGWEKRIGALGITASTPVAIYDDNSSKDAARMWWILRFWGMNDVRIVNGGWRGYLKTGGPLDKGEHKADAVKIILNPGRDRLALKAQLLEQIKQGSNASQIVDTRSIGEYCGTERNAARNGSIPGAKHLEWSDTLDPNTGRFKTAAELNRIFHEAGLDPRQPAVTYCQSGGRASVIAFALELMGGKDVRNYYKSWGEWGNDPDTPIETPKGKK
jgi:thiosulfate/3-mercaptopyruvate sulfurtransferase